MTHATYRDFTSDQLAINLSDALDYYRAEIGEHDIPTYGYAAEGFAEAERIFALPYDERIDALDNIGGSGSPEDYVKHHAAALRLAALENDEWRMVA